MQVKLHEISRAVGKTDNLNCLDVGIDNGMMAYHLRKLGGKWHSAVRNESIAQSVRSFVETNVDIIEGRALPFKKKIFDVVVVLDFLERVEEDYSFIEECHRILQPTGRLIVNVQNVKAWTLITSLRRMLGVTYRDRGWVRPGYTESQLFSILKHGFDVHQMRSYSRFLVEMVDTIVLSMAQRAGVRDPGNPAARNRIYAIGNIFYKLAYQLDMFLFMGRGFYLIATAKRRAWRPRNAPVLVDGRSISEAVLSKAGD